MTSPIVMLHTDNPEPARQIVAELHPDLELHLCDDNGALSGLLRDTKAEVLYSIRFSATPPFPRQALIDAPDLKWISIGGSGVNHLTPWDSERVTVTNAAGVAADMMAQYALGAMLHFTLDLPRFRAAQQRRDWIEGQVEPINGKTTLIVGMGKTGQAVARVCKAMGMQTIGVRAHPDASSHVDETHHFSALPDLWARADFIVVCVPLLASTRGLIGPSAFETMKPSAVIIDVSRGTVINEAALLHALDTGQITGAALDVFATEPLPREHALWGYESVIITPHCSSVYDGWDLKSVRMFADNLTRYRSGETLLNVVDPTKGY